jgi:hypothetical protein
LADLARRVKHVGDGKTIPKLLRKRMRSAVLPAVREAKSHARSLPVKGPRSTGLRAAMARGIVAQVKLTGDPVVAVRLPRKALGDRESLPGWANRAGELRVGQAVPGWRDWFDGPMEAAHDDVRKQIVEAIKDIDGMCAHG